MQNELDAKLIVPKVKKPAAPTKPLDEKTKTLEDAPAVGDETAP